MYKTVKIQVDEATKENRSSEFEGYSYDQGSQDINEIGAVTSSGKRGQAMGGMDKSIK